MSSDIAIRVENLSKQYRIGGPQARYQTFRETLTEAFVSPFRRARNLLRGNPGAAADLTDTIWALKDVSFEVKRGEVLGIIGPNGAGKSTLLKILSRITEPTEGRAEISGRVGSLLEVGTGFHPELTGRENIFLNGAILGMSRLEVDQKLAEILAFAEVERFADTPIKHFSSGMYLRLAFSVAAHLDTSTLLVDEVLAVGDVRFRRKCLGKLEDVSQRGRTVIFVSHNMAAVSRLCTQGLLLEDGRIKLLGTTESAVSSYLGSSTVLTGRTLWPKGLSTPSSEELVLHEVSITDKDGQVTPSVNSTQPFWINLKYELRTDLAGCRFGIVVSTSDGTVVLETYDADDPEALNDRTVGQHLSRCGIPAYLLNAGRYFVSINIGIFGVRNLLRRENVIAFDVEDTGSPGSHFSERRKGVVRPQLEWLCEPLTFSKVRAGVSRHHSHS